MEDSISRVHLLGNNLDIKVHYSLCEELVKVLDVVTGLIPAIELARPGCKTGIQELCALNGSVDKGTQIVRNCGESSKLYSVITRQATVARCERILVAITKSLCVIQSMVQEPLATKIENCLGALGNTKFSIDSNEEEAGKVLLSLLRQPDVDEASELEAFQVAASRLNLTSSRALLLERRCIRNLLEKFHGADVKKERILIYLLSVLKKHGKAVVLDAFQCKESITGTGNNFARSSPNRNGSERTTMLTEFEGELSENENHTEKLIRNGIQCEKILENGNQPESSTQHMPPDEFLCPLSSQLMFDPVTVASGETYERIWIEKWLREGNDICPRTHKKLSDLCTVPNSSLKNLISQWCQRHGTTVKNPSLQPIPTAFRSNIPSSSSVPTAFHTSDIVNSSSISTAFRTSDSLSSISSLPYVSSVLLYNKTAQYRFEKGEDTPSISDDASFCSNVAAFGGSDDSPLYGKSTQCRDKTGEDTTSISHGASFCSNSATIEGFDNLTEVHDQRFAWSGMYRKYKSFDSFSYGCFLKFLSELSDLPPHIYNQSLEDIKLLIGSDSDTVSVMLSHRFKEALVEFVGYAFESSNLRAQKTGLEILQALISNSRCDLPGLDNDASFLLTRFLHSGLTLESLSLIRIMCGYIGCIPSIVDSGISSSILRIVDSGQAEFLELTVEILSQLSSISGIRSQILSHGRLAKIVPLLREKKLAKSCLKILLDLCNAAECAAVAEADSCIALVAELLETGSQDEQADAVAILLSLCAGVPDYSRLVMGEGVIPALVAISVNGSKRGKYYSQKLLQLLRDRRPNENLRCSSPTIQGSQFQRRPAPMLPPRSPISPSQSPVEKRHTSKSYGFFGRLFFSKPKSVVRV